LDTALALIEAYPGTQPLIARMVLADFYQKLTEFLCLFQGAFDGGFPAVMVLFGQMRKHGLGLMGA